MPGVKDCTSVPWPVPQVSDDQTFSAPRLDEDLLHVGADVAAARPARHVLDLQLRSIVAPRWTVVGPPTAITADLGVGAGAVVRRPAAAPAAVCCW